MHGVDLAPRIWLVLFLPSGMTLMAAGPLGDEFFVNGWLLVLVWVGVLAWLAVASSTTAAATPRSARLLQRADLVVRYALGAVAARRRRATRWSPASRSAWTRTRSGWAPSSAAYALCIFCGVLIRRELLPVRARVRQAW